MPLVLTDHLESEFHPFICAVTCESPLRPSRDAPQRRDRWRETEGSHSCLKSPLALPS